MTLTQTGELYQNCFYNCENLNLYFSVNHTFLMNKDIPPFIDIHDLYMNNFKEPNTAQDILKQSLWLN